MAKRKQRAVLVFLLKDTFVKSKVVVIKYTSGPAKDCYDIPGHAIIDNIADSVKTAMWDFHEETGMFMYDPIYKGKAVIETADEIYDIDLYVSTNYEGRPKKFADHRAMWISTTKVLFMSKSTPSVELLRYLAKDQVNVYIRLDRKERIVDIIEK